MKQRKKVRGKKTTYKSIEFASKYEAALAQEFDNMGIIWEYEPIKVAWQPPPSTYRPDFKVTLPTGETFYVEAKGYFYPKDRTKMKCIKEQHPEIPVKMLFQKSELPLYTGAKTTYADWARNNGYDCWDVPLPKVVKAKKAASKAHTKSKRSKNDL